MGRSLSVGEHEIWRQCPGKNPHKCGRLLGFNKKGKEYLASHRWEDDFPAGAEAAVRAEIEEDPRWIGPPIAVMGLDENGPYWIKRGSRNSRAPKRVTSPR